MGRNWRGHHVWMQNDDGESSHTSHSIELSRQSSSNDVSLKIGPGDDKKHEHLLSSGPLGKCSDPYCAICPSYLGPTTRTDNTQNRRKRAGMLDISGILNPHTKVVQRWNKVFCISSVIAIFIDPMFFFLFSVREDYKCLVYDNTAAVTITVVRTLTDALQVCHILLQFRLAYEANSWIVRNSGELEDDPKKIAKHYLQGWFVLDLFTALPIPQLLFWTVVKRYTRNGANYAKNVLRVVVLLQNVPRALRLFPRLIGRSSSGFAFENAWGYFVINLLMYLLGGHMVGSFWYLFGLQRVNQCLQDKCQEEAQGTFTCQNHYLDCGSNRGNSHAYSGERLSWIDATNVSTKCLGEAPDFFYGIYNAGVKVAMERNIIVKYIYSLFWGFQQISSLAGNLVPSLFVWEVVFTMGIVGLGLLLFALLVGNMQNFLMALGAMRRQKMKLEMQLQRYDTEGWMKRRKLPRPLRRRVRRAGRLRWVATEGVVERKLMANLPEDLQRDVQRYLCLELVKKVPFFKLLQVHVLDAVCERLHQKLYIEDSAILLANMPVERMLFVVRGTLESIGEDGSVATLKEGDFCGEEILSWYIDVWAGVSEKKSSGSAKSMGKHPLSRRTVRCVTNVEAFSLETDGLEYITIHYKHAFKSREVQGAIRYFSLYWRSYAARRIQQAWRAHRARVGLTPVPSSYQQRLRVTRFAPRVIIA